MHARDELSIASIGELGQGEGVGGFGVALIIASNS